MTQPKHIKINGDGSDLIHVIISEDSIMSCIPAAIPKEIYAPRYIHKNEFNVVNDRTTR